jgi:hypothetical protein
MPAAEVMVIALDAVVAAADEDTMLDSIIDTIHCSIYNLS